MSKRYLVLGAALILPFSTAAATVAQTTPPAGRTVPLAAGPVSEQVSVTGARSPNAPKVAPFGTTLVNGHGAVVEGTVKQRVQQVSAMSSYNIPVAALEAYQAAAASVAASDASCHLSWTVLAGIGTVESDNGQYGGAVILANGDTSPHILGPVLDGTGGVGAIRDTDGGRFDGNAFWDRAVGPMQFIPGTWAAYGADGNGDGVSDPNNIDDAALGAAHYLCAGGGDLQVPGQQRAAIMRYNHSVAYVDLVMRLADAYAHGAGVVVPNGIGAAPRVPVTHHGSHPAVQPPSHHRPGNGLGGNGSAGHRSGGKGGGHGSGHGTGGHGSPPPHLPPIHTDPVQKPPAHLPPIHTDPVQKPPAHLPPIHTDPVQKPPAQTSPPTQPTPPLVTGVLARCATGWCIDTTPLDFGATADLTLKQADYNGDGKTRSVQRELRSLIGQTFTVTLVDAPPAGSTPALGSTPPAGSTPAPGSTPAAASETPAAPSTAGSAADNAEQTDPTVYAITIDATGLVTTINLLPYLVTPA